MVRLGQVSWRISMRKSFSFRNIKVQQSLINRLLYTLVIIRQLSWNPSSTHFSIPEVIMINIEHGICSPTPVFIIDVLFLFLNLSTLTLFFIDFRRFHTVRSQKKNFCCSCTVKVDNEAAMCELLHRRKLLDRPDVGRIAKEPFEPVGLAIVWVLILSVLDPDS